MTVLTLNIHHKGARGIEVPAMIKRIFFETIAKVLFIKLDLPSAPPRSGLSRIPLHDNCQYETADYDPDIPTQNGGLSPRFVNILNIGGTTPTTAEGHYAEKELSTVLKKVYQTIEQNELRLQEQDRKDTLKQEWQQLALVLDRLLLLVFILVTITVTLVVLIPQDYNKSYASNGL